MTYEEAYAKSRGGMHLYVDQHDRRRAHGGNPMTGAILCNTGDGHASHTNHLKGVTCEACRALAEVLRIRAEPGVKIAALKSFSDDEIRRAKHPSTAMHMLAYNMRAERGDFD